MIASRLRHAVLCAVFPVFALAGPARADLTLHEISPEEGTTGTAIEIVLSGDAAKKPKKTPLKASVPQPDDGIEGGFRLEAGFKNTKTGAGVHDLHVKPKGTGLGTTVF